MDDATQLRNPIQGRLHTAEVGLLFKSARHVVETLNEATDLEGYNSIPFSRIFCSHGVFAVSHHIAPHALRQFHPNSPEFELLWCSQICWQCRHTVQFSRWRELAMFGGTIFSTIFLYPIFLSCEFRPRQKLGFRLVHGQF